MFLELWNLKVLTKLWLNLRQYLNVCIFFSLFFYIYLRNKHNKRLTHLLIPLFGFTLSLVCHPLNVCSLNENLEIFYIRFHLYINELVSFHFSILFKFYTISKFKRTTKSFHRILLILSRTISLNPGPAYNIVSHRF